MGQPSVLIHAQYPQYHTQCLSVASPSILHTIGMRAATRGCHLHGGAVREARGDVRQPVDQQELQHLHRSGPQQHDQPTNVVAWRVPMDAASDPTA
jgi:hypothetical protein